MAEGAAGGKASYPQPRMPIDLPLAGRSINPDGGPKGGYWVIEATVTGLSR